jgi:hypothetical protein
MGWRWRRALAVLGLLLLSSPAVAQGEAAVSGGDRQAILGVIGDQLAAFQRDDSIAAFSYASPMIQRKFGNPAVFMTMVRSGYAAVYRPSEVQFLETTRESGRTRQFVRFVGPDGQAVVAVYEMQRQDDGSWRINGVYLLALDETVS